MNEIALRQCEARVKHLSVALATEEHKADALRQQLAAARAASDEQGGKLVQAVTLLREAESRAAAEGDRAAGLEVMLENCKAKRKQAEDEREQMRRCCVKRGEKLVVLMELMRKAQIPQPEDAESFLVWQVEYLIGKRDAWLEAEDRILVLVTRAEAAEAALEEARYGADSLRLELGLAEARWQKAEAAHGLDGLIDKVANDYFAIKVFAASCGVSERELVPLTENVIVLRNCAQNLADALAAWDAARVSTDEESEGGDEDGIQGNAETAEVAQKG